MELLRERRSEVNKLLQQHPKHKSEIIDLYQLMEDEISDGESPDNEWEKFISDVKQLTE